MSKHIPVFRPCLDTDYVLRRLEEPITGRWLGQGQRVDELEQILAHFVGAKHFVCTSSCTAALHLAVHCLDLPKGTRVLTTPITFVASNAVLLWEGLIPVFGETEEGMLTDDHRAHRTEATMLVHLGGAQCQLDTPEVPTPVIEDCAHAFGAPWARQQGENMRCWSFHAVKTLPMGDGGGISTNDDELAARLRRLRWFGIDKSTDERSRNGAYQTDYSIQELGWKYQMNDVTAAIGLAGMGMYHESPGDRVEKQRLKRVRIAERYSGTIPSLGPYAYEPFESSCHFYPRLFEDAAQREAVERELTADNIAFSRHYKPNWHFAPFENFERYDQDRAKNYYDTCLILPMFPDMTDEEVDRVIAACRRAAK